MRTKNVNRWLESRPGKWTEDDMVTITLPREYLVGIRAVIRKHNHLGDKLGWPCWLREVWSGYEIDEVLGYLNGKLRRKRSTTKPTEAT